MVQRESHNGRRVSASVAATLISLACGTNYVYSAWAPQFAERLGLSSTESNFIGSFGNLGVYSLGVPVGIILDRSGPRVFVLLGSALLAAGYFSLHQAYDSGAGYVPALCFYSFVTGLGSCMAFAAAVKTSALNWPHHRGTATAFPIAAFGLGAFFFSFLGSFFFPGDPSAFLKLLSWGTFCCTLIGFFFLRTSPQAAYRPLACSDLPPPTPDTVSSGSTNRARTGACKPFGLWPAESSTSSGEIIDTTHRAQSYLEPGGGTLPDEDQGDVDETSSLSTPTTSRLDSDRGYQIDIRGCKLLRTLSFWLLFSIMALLAGVGLMTINNIGNDVNALWKHFDDSLSKPSLVHKQQVHVSIISICSFLGRLISGIGSDFLAKRLHASRIWCLAIACVVFLAAQVSALVIQNPNFLGFVSGLSGFGYGLLFGVFPSLVTDAFGIRGLSQNWGFMTLAPVLSSGLFNLFYGQIYDSHSIVDSEGKRYCIEGVSCYYAAYWISFGACYQLRA
ncbi:MFS transporter [Ophiocordyceps camponoti-floridani]|uniref:MFS transporter n=1 Tax=Ophiocordyceps camponoti-floridani TaxID=2030778 RepID=A0A8H4VF16_9HYPO|nr:MFS transporter [Ophiocordyceps camponoti-floridani]